MAVFTKQVINFLIIQKKQYQSVEAAPSRTPNHVLSENQIAYCIRAV